MVLPHIRVVARAILSNNADVDDAVQVALMRVLEGLESFRGDASLVRWTRRVAARVSLRMREQEVRRLQVVAAATAQEPGPRANGQDAGRDDELWAHLDELPAVQREAVVLRHMLGYSLAEVAQQVDAPVDTVKSRLLYGRRALRKLLRRAALVDDSSLQAGGRAS